MPNLDNCNSVRIKNLSVTVIILTCLAILAAPPAGYAEPSVCGDINQDQLINIGDAVYLLNHVFRGGPICDPVSVADVNMDGSVNIGDAVYLIKFIFRNGQAPCSETALSLQKIYFEVMYENYAWGYALNGIYIDSDGLIYSYSWEHGSDPWQRGDSLTEEDLFEKYSHNPEVIGHLDHDFLQAKIGQIEPAAAGPVSPPVYRCADFGIYYYLAYTFDSLAGIYTPVILYQAGDEARKNYSLEAFELFDWLAAYESGAPICGYPEPAIDQKYLFDVTHVNYAWGYTLRGFYIDSTGVVYSYDHSDQQWQPESGDGYTEAELEEKYSHNRFEIGRVYRNILGDRFDMVDRAEEGPLSPRVNVCYDFGGVSFVAYKYDANAGLYRPVTLYEAGDWARKNFAPEAEYLLQWLWEVNPDYADPPCGYPD